MAIVINGSGTVTGLAVGGLPDGTVDAGTLATDSVVTGKIADGTIANADIADLAASKLTGALPAISGASLTNLPGGGKILQVVSYILDDSSAISTSSSSLVSTSVTLNITPAATSSKILILFNVGECYGASDWSLYRGSSAISSMGGGNLGAIARTITSNYIDSPSSTSAVTYTIYHKSSTGAAYLKNNTANTVSLIAMEIGA